MALRYGSMNVHLFRPINIQVNIFHPQHWQKPGIVCRYDMSVIKQTDRLDYLKSACHLFLGTCICRIIRTIFGQVHHFFKNIRIFIREIMLF